MRPVIHSFKRGTRARFPALSARRAESALGARLVLNEIQTDIGAYWRDATAATGAAPQ
jgi:hypothetical protein